MEPKEMLELYRQLKPMIGPCVQELLALGPELRKMAEAFGIGAIDIRANMVFHLESRGFSREEAILMTMDEWYGFRKLAERKNAKKE